MPPKPEIYKSVSLPQPKTNFSTRAVHLILRKIRPVCSLVHGQVRRETNDTPRATAQTSVISLSLFVLSDNHSYDHGSVNAATLPRHKPTYTRPHTTGVLSSTMSYNLWARAIAIPADLANSPTTNRLFFTRDGLCPPFAISPYLLPCTCLDWTLLDYGWYDIR